MDSLINANAYLASSWLIKNICISYIFGSLIYSLKVIHLDTCIIVEEFTNCLEYPHKILNFRRINIKHNNTSTSAKIVLKFVSPKLPKKFTKHMVIHNVSPSTRSSVQCLRCVRFKYTQTICHGKQRCNRCDNFGYNIDA